MKLAADSDASYFSEPKARSREGGHFFLSNNAEIPANNGAILNIGHIIKHVMSSATEAELAGLYIMAREAVCIVWRLQQCCTDGILVVLVHVACGTGSV